MDYDRWGSASSTLLVLIRHGERADEAGIPNPTPFPYDIPWDPPLTYLGVEQAKATGKYLSEIIPSFHSRKIIFYSSPLTRTLQTVANIINSCDLNNTHKINIANALCEDLITHYFPVDPQIHLPIRTSSCREFCENYLDGVEYIDQADQIKYKYPEWGCTERICGFCEDIMDGSLEEGTLVICGVHGGAILELCDYYGEQETGWKYCSIYAARRDPGVIKPRITIKNLYSPYFNQFSSSNL